MVLKAGFLGGAGFAGVFPFAGRAGGGGFGCGDAVVCLSCECEGGTAAADFGRTSCSWVGSAFRNSIGLSLGVGCGSMASVKSPLFAQFLLP